MNAHKGGNESGAAPRWSEQERQRYAALVRPRREERGLSQDDVAEMADVTRRTIGNIERGATIPQADILRRVMIALDLYGNAFESFSESTRAYLATLAPLIERIPEPPLSTVMRGVQATLAAAVEDGDDWRGLALAARRGKKKSETAVPHAE